MCAEKLWEIFYENGDYDACFVSGVIGNVFDEGEFGILQGGCNWELYNKGGTTLKGKEKIKNIAEANAACNTPKDFGVGMLQWSYPARMQRNIKKLLQFAEGL